MAACVFLVESLRQDGVHARTRAFDVRGHLANFDVHPMEEAISEELGEFVKRRKAKGGASTKF
ncbi:MAG: hypothetical protein ABJG80_11830 [Paracoccaceae bacterium]